MCTKFVFYLCFWYDWGVFPFWRNYDLDKFFQHWLWTQHILGCFRIYGPLCIFQPHYFFGRYPSGKEPESHFFFSSPRILKLALKRWNDQQWLPRRIWETEKLHEGFLMHTFLSILTTHLNVRTHRWEDTEAWALLTLLLYYLFIYLFI